MDNNISELNSENQKNNDFLSALGESDLNLIPKPKENEIKTVIAKQEAQKLKDQLADKQIEEKINKRQNKSNTKIEKRVSMEDMQADNEKSESQIETPTETVVEENIVVQPEPEKNDIKVEDKVEETEKKVEETPKPAKKKSSPKKEVEIVTPEVAETIESNKIKPKNIVKKEVEFNDVDEFDHKILENNDPIITNGYEDEDTVENLNIEQVNKIIDDEYEDKKEASTDEKVDVEIVQDETSKKEENERKFRVDRKQVHEYYGGKDSEDFSFKLRSTKSAKILRSLDIQDTTAIQSADINSKTAQERQDIYLKTVLPTLQPSLSIVPFIISGVVISMSAFTWPDIQELLKIEDKVADLDPAERDYFYEKNKLFIEKRRKQLDLFYKHITSVSGYVEKPSQDELFGRILKFPDFQQLFFAAYSASFLKDYQFDITCATCGTNNAKMVNSKDLCFLLNSNINIKQLNHFIECGASADTSESAKVFKEFQEEKLVEMSNSTYRTELKLPVSSFIYDLKIPTILDAINAMEEIVETFKDKDLSFTDLETGNTVYVDSSFGLPPELLELKKYLYINNLIVPRIVDEDKENNKAKVSFVNFKEKRAIINSVFQLSPEDYKTLMNDKNLNKLIKVSGIRHAINAGVCSEPTCGSDLGSIPVEPEMLFFIIARQESQ